MKEIPLTQGKFALVDDEDFEWLNQWKWSYHKIGYAKRNIYLGGGRKAPKYQTIKMHRLILGTPTDKDTDHINRDQLDNRRENLRVCTRTQNQYNRGTWGVSPFRGVSWFKETEKWRAKITKGGHSIHIGYFYSERDAARAYDLKATELFGEFAFLNKA